MDILVITSFTYNSLHSPIYPEQYYKKKLTNLFTPTQKKGKGNVVWNRKGKAITTIYLNCITNCNLFTSSTIFEQTVYHYLPNSPNFTPYDMCVRVYVSVSVCERDRQTKIPKKKKNWERTTKEYEIDNTHISKYLEEN